MLKKGNYHVEIWQVLSRCFKISLRNASISCLIYEILLGSEWLLTNLIATHKFANIFQNRSSLLG